MLRKVINLKEGLKLTYGARARSVGARRSSSAAAMWGAGASRRGIAEERSARGGAMTSRCERGDVGRRMTAFGADPGLPGPVQDGLGRSGPWWAGSGGPDRFRFGWTAQEVWTGRGRAGLGRLGPGSAWGRGRAGLAGIGRRGPSWSRPIRAGPG